MNLVSQHTIYCYKYDYTTLPFSLTIEPGDAPTNFNAAVVNVTAIRLTWSPPLLPYGILLSYTITYNASNGNISIMVNATHPRNYLTAQLEEHTWYRFELLASTRVGGGPYTTLTTRTDIDGIHIPYKRALLVYCSIIFICSSIRTP